MRRAVLLVLFLSACASAPISPPVLKSERTACVTPCGLVTLTDDCETFVKVESVIIDAFSKHIKGLNTTLVCKAFDGWYVKVHRPNELDKTACGDGWYFPQLNGCVLGYTYKQFSVVEVESGNWSVSSLTHELVHVVDIARTGEAGHCGWQSRGVDTAIKEVTGFPDPSSRADCPEWDR